MFKPRPFLLDDVKPMLEEPMNAPYAAWKLHDYAYPKLLAQKAHAMTATVNDEPMACIFLVELWPKRAYLSSVFSEKVSQHSISVYRGLRKSLLALPYDRIEFDCPIDFELGHRRAEFMGFTVMCPLARKYGPDGEDAKIFEWVR